MTQIVVAQELNLSEGDIKRLKKTRKFEDI